MQSDPRQTLFSEKSTSIFSLITFSPSWTAGERMTRSWINSMNFSPFCFLFIRINLHVYTCCKWLGIVLVLHRFSNYLYNGWIRKYQTAFSCLQNNIWSLLKFNTGMPSSALTERLVSLGRLVLTLRMNTCFERLLLMRRNHSFIDKNIR